MVLPTAPSWNPSDTHFYWLERGALYKNNPHRTFAFVGFFNKGKTIASIDPEVLNQVAFSKGAWDRVPIVALAQNFPRECYNVGSGRMDTGYMRHKRIIAPVFTEDLYHRVWKETILVYDAIREAGNWEKQNTIVLPDLINEVTSFITLAVIAKVGFDVDVHTKEAEDADETMSLHRAFDVLSRNFIMKGVLPQWLFSLPIKSLQNIQKASDIITTTMRNKFSARRAASKRQVNRAEEKDIFGRLLAASDAETPSQALTDDEILSNTFLMLLAGHETGSKGLSITLGLLACHPEEQDSLYKLVQEVIPHDRVPAFEDFDALVPLRNALMEALRLYPVASLLFRQATEDTTLNIPGLPHPLAIEKGTIFTGDYISAGWDDSLWPSPYSYLPSRWTNGPLSADTMQFGLGIHTCLGRRFALYESVCFLAMFLKEWQVFPGEMRPGETLQGWRKRVLEDNVQLAVTLGPSSVPVRLERRRP
ncbi:cytochrome P450 [Dacryopinax primogenitus]|uniref:Cytochrome P450 n=1 Tax=Dacryopinax primogenitus (strain DJM 731) TaxID=1858805 RepID=M5FXU0_DACPD|nr:cytochrome P450 [Dacryopinax primogenitus]EJT98351.1 cytochrome P450 [Dacryopinax primogenitus]